MRAIFFHTVNKHVYHLVANLIAHKSKKNLMPEYAQTWRKKLRLKVLIDIAKQEIEEGKESNQIYEKLDCEMQIRWKLVSSTRKQYLDDIKKILTNQYVLVFSNNMIKI